MHANNPEFELRKVLNLTTADDVELIVKNVPQCCP